MVPILDEIIHDAAETGVQHVMIAMAHRGRLNVLAHILQKPYTQVLAEFKDPLFTRSWRIDLGWMGDVKYHAGARVETTHDDLPKQIIISMPPNPSHLEAVDPVLNGMARAAETSASNPGAPIVDKGQGAGDPDPRRFRVPGPGRGGRDVEPVAPRRLRRWRDHSPHRQQPARVHDRSRGIIQHQLCERAGARLQDSNHHVNADDPVACIEAARLAIAYRSASSWIT
jgi:2-oxoglutarate dehydrogenase E1 component